MLVLYQFNHGAVGSLEKGDDARADVERLEREVSRGGELAFERRGSTIRLRRRAPQLDPDRPLDDQLASGREFVEQLAWLRDWWRDSGCELVAGCLRSPTES